MGLLDQMAGQILGSLAGDGKAAGTEVGATSGVGPAVLQAVMALIQNSEGGLGGLLARLAQGGLAEQVASWVGGGVNLPVSGEQLAAAVGRQLMEVVSRQSGLGSEELAQGLASALPQVVDKLTPDGAVPPSDVLLQQGLAALTGLFGSRA
ncbi:MAG: DUF937 domain-containing protein [Zoogloeaceae bacterium]|nr:DUF937 domain-containing protein [Zoogloeaceae bacterium]